MVDINTNANISTQFDAADLAQLTAAQTNNTNQVQQLSQNIANNVSANNQLTKAVSNLQQALNNNKSGNTSDSKEINGQITRLINKIDEDTKKSSGFISGIKDAFSSKIPTPYTIGYNATNALLNQLVQIFKDFFSWSKIAGAYATARRAEATIGNYRNEDDRLFNTQNVTSFRIEMSKLGASIENADKALVDFHSRGFTGVNAATAAIGSQASRTVFGDTFTASVTEALYKATQGSSDNLLRTKQGNFTDAPAVQTIAMLSKASQTANGVQAGFTNLLSITQSLIGNLRGMNNNVSRLLGDLGVFGRLLAENNITQQDALGMLEISKQTSAQQQYNLLSFAGVPGNRLLEAREEFIRAGLSDKQGENAQLAAKAVIGLYSRLSGTEKERSVMLRDLMSQIGLGQQARSIPDLVKTMTAIANGSQAAIEEWKEAGRTDHDVLVSTAKGINALLDPLKAIRNMIATFIVKVPIFNMFDDLQGLGEYISKTGGDFETALSGGASGDDTKDLLKQIAANTGTSATHMGTLVDNTNTSVGGSD